MPYKRTRSAAAQQPQANSSDVTDYMGPPITKRKKSTAQPAISPVRVTKQSKAANTRQKTRQQRVEDEDEEEDDDDGSVHVAFNQVSSAVNEARLGQPRTINGLQTEERQTGPNGVSENENEEGLEGEAEEVNEEEVLHPRQKRGRPAKATQTRQQHPRPNQQHRPNTRSRAKAVGSADGIYDKPTPRQERSPVRRKASSHLDRTSNGKSTPRQIQQQRQEISKEDEESASEDEDGEGNMQGAAALAAEDSAFIDAPRPEVNLPEVKQAVRSLGGMIKTLSHPAWTGVKNWDEDPEVACSTKTGGVLIEYLRQLNDLLLDSCDARYEGDADGDPAVTIDYLRRNNVKVKGLFADIASIIDLICTQKLAAADNLGPLSIQSRKRFLSDIAKRLIPMLVLVIQKTFEVGPSEKMGNVVHLTLNSFTIQFPLRPIGWAIRLAERFSRALTQWPIDDEFGQSDEELDIVELARKQAKTKKRELFCNQLASLYLAVKKAADALEKQARVARIKARQEQDRRQAMIRGRELWAKNERQRLEVKRRENMQREKFIQATQALRSAPDPLAFLWEQASQPGNASVASQASASSHAAGVPVPRSSKGKERAVPNFEDDIDFFLNNHNDHPRGSPVQNSHVLGNLRTQNSSARRVNGLHLAQATEAWGAPIWSKVEEKRLVLRMKYDKNYNPSDMATKLGRSIDDMARKAAELKAVYRAIYTRRGVDIPAWVW